MKKVLYTVGYSGFEIDDFVMILKENKISDIVDVRSVPYSKRFFNYNADVLKPRLRKDGLRYVNFKDEFGARQLNKKYLSENGKYLDFEKFQQSENFQTGYRRICKGILNLNCRIALMCAEKDPVNCHRAIMISRYFSLNNFQVIHILPGMLKTQKDIDNELLCKYFKDVFRLNAKGELLSRFGSAGNLALLDLMDCNYKKVNDYIYDAYRKQNEKIAYQRADDDLF